MMLMVPMPTTIMNRDFDVDDEPRAMIPIGIENYYTLVEMTTSVTATIANCIKIALVTRLLLQCCMFERSTHSHMAN